MPAVPFLVQGGLAAGGAIAGHYAAKSAARGAMERTPDEQAATDRQTGLATTAGQQGRQLLNQGAEGVARPLNYYGSLLGGNRAGIRSAVAPEMAEINDAYKGADTAVSGKYLQGGERNQAIAENARGRAGQIGRLIAGVRPMAAQGAAQLGSQLIGQGQQGQYLAGGLNRDLISSGFQNRLLGQRAGADAANQWGRLFGQLSSIYSQGSGQRNDSGGGASGAPPGSIWGGR